MSADDEIEVFRVRNPDAMDVWPFRELFEDAVANATHPVDPDDARADLYPLIRSGFVALLIARYGTGYRSLCMVALPHKTRIDPQASVISSYSAGPKAVTNAMMQAVFDLARQEGYQSLGILNGRKRDAAFERLVRPFMGEGEALGTFYRFPVRDE